MMKNYFKFLIAFFTITIFLVSCGRGSDSPNPPATDTQKPTAPTTLTTNNITTNSFTLNWTASTDNVGVTGYIVYVNSTSFSTTATTLDITGLSSATSYTVYVKAKDSAGNISDASNSVNVTTLTPIVASSSLTQPVITVSNFRALQLNACSNQDFTVAFPNGNSARTLQSATFTLYGSGAGAFRSLRYRPAGDFTTPWKQVDFSGNSVTVPFSVIIPAGLTAKYDLKVCTKASVSGIVNGANTTLAISSIATDESGVNAPVGSSFQAAVALPALDLVTTPTVITSSVVCQKVVGQLTLSANQTISQSTVVNLSNNKANGPSGATFAGIILKNKYGNVNIYPIGNWGTRVNLNSSIFVAITTPASNGDYYNITSTGATLQTNGDTTHYGIKVDLQAGTNGFTSDSTFGFSLMSKWDVVFQNSNGNDINLTDVAVYDNTTLLTN